MIKPGLFLNYNSNINQKKMEILANEHAWPFHINSLRFLGNSFLGNLAFRGFPAKLKTLLFCEQKAEWLLYFSLQQYFLHRF